MRPNFINLALAFFAVIATAMPVLAAEISDFKIEDLPKKIRLTFEFTDVAAYSLVSDFNSNILVLNYEGLELSGKQKAKDHRLEGGKDFDVLRFVRFQDTGGQAEIRVYLGWEVTPADAQVIAFDDRIEVDILKPVNLTDPVADPTLGEGEWEIKRDPDPIEDDTEVEPDIDEPDETVSAGPDASSGLQLGSLRQPEYPAFDSGDTDDEGSVETDSPAEIGTGQDESGADDPADGPDDFGDADQPSDFRPAREFTATPSYKKFDLDEVEVNQLEFRGVPFNLVLLDLVAGTGFNVVVGEGIDNKELTLNFTKKKMSLKSALYVLCTAYDLEYTVEDDAIIIRAKK